MRISGTPVGDRIRVSRTPAPDPLKGYLFLDGTSPQLIVSAERPAKERTRAAGRLMRFWRDHRSRPTE